jgi:hypothetical protein
MFLGMSVEMPQFSNYWSEHVRGRFVRSNVLSSSIVRDPIRGKGNRANESMIRDKSRKRLALHSSSCRCNSHDSDSILPSSTQSTIRYPVSKLWGGRRPMYREGIEWPNKNDAVRRKNHAIRANVGASS